MDITQKCSDCHEVHCTDSAAPYRCITCQNKQVDDDTYVNYSRPEQPSRKFEKRDIEDLKGSLDNDIRRLEGMRGVEFDRNYLHYNESAELNRAKLTRMIVTKYIQQNP